MLDKKDIKNIILFLHIAKLSIPAGYGMFHHTRNYSPFIDRIDKLIQKLEDELNDINSCDKKEE